MFVYVPLHRVMHHINQYSIAASIAIGLGAHTNSWPMVVVYMCVGVLVENSLFVIWGGRLQAPSMPY